MIESLVETIARQYEPSRHRDLLAALWEEERWFDTPHQRRAAEVLRGALGEAGLEEVRLVPFAADGRTRWQDWTTHLAWECTAARLGLGDLVLADRSARPQAVVQWSGPLGPVSAPVVDGDALGEIVAPQVAGKFVLTARPPRDMKELLRGTGALAVVSDFLGEAVGYDEDTTRWCNAWADGPDGWYFRAADRVMPGFCLAPRQGRLLRERLAADPQLRLDGFCRSGLYEDASQCVTAVLPGQDRSREVWIFAHACEQGANDNASGVSALAEAVAVLARLIERRVLPRPRFSIRVIATEECIGMLAFATEHADVRQRALAGLNVDSVGDPSGPERPFKIFFGPLSAPTIGWAVAGVLGRILRDQARGEYHLACQYLPPTADDMIADPACGIPTLWLGRGKDSVAYHSSRDTPAICDPVSLRSSAVLVAAWAYAMAAMDDAWVRSIRPAAERWMAEHLLPARDPEGAQLRQWAAARLWRDLARWGVSASAYEPAAARHGLPEAEPLADLPTGGPRLIRRTWGTCTFETLPPERARDFSRWSLRQAVALYWANGSRTLGAVERLTRAECGLVPEGGLAPLAEACVEAGLARWA